MLCGRRSWVPAGAKLKNDGTFTASSGFSISGTLIGVGVTDIRLNIINRGTARSCYAGQACSMYVYDGATFEYCSAGPNGKLNILPGGIAVEPVVSSGGVLEVRSGGSALLVTSNTGAQIILVDGGYITYKTN